MKPKTRLKKLEKVLQEYSIEPLGKHCVGMEGVIEEGVETMQDNERSPLLDPLLIGTAQRIEHYEIAGYGTAAALAKALGYTTAVTTLVEILEQEESTDEKLTVLAERFINKEALTMSEKYAM